MGTGEEVPEGARWRGSYIDGAFVWHVFEILPRFDLANQIDTLGADSLLPRCTDHKPIQHRDGKPPWCGKCGLP